MAIERKTVTKRNERHPADVLQPLAADQPASTPAAASPISPPVQPQSPAPAEDRYESTPPGVPEDGPKVPTSFRIPRRLLDRLDKGARVIPAALDKNLSKNQLVENALDEYLKRFGL